MYHKTDYYINDTMSISSDPWIPYKTIDALNARYGKGKVFSAAEGIGERSWQMKRSKLSKRASTRWDELMVVK